MFTFQTSLYADGSEPSFLESECLHMNHLKKPSNSTIEIHNTGKFTPPPPPPTKTFSIDQFCQDIASPILRLHASLERRGLLDVSCFVHHFRHLCVPADQKLVLPMWNLNVCTLIISIRRYKSIQHSLPPKSTVSKTPHPSDTDLRM